MARTRSRCRPSEAERARRREAHRRQLVESVEALLTSDGWARWVRIRARNGLGRYSLHNQLLIALQRPNATYVCGFKAWIELGYCVRKGERAIRLLAPQKVRIEADDPVDQDADETRIFFRAVPVFDRGQVEPLPDRDQALLEPLSQAITGDSHAHLITPLERFAGELGYRVRQIPDTGSADGWCDSERHAIVVRSAAPANARVRILVHELAHALGIGYEGYGRQLAEVLVDTVTFIVCAGAGLDVSGESVPYVAGWGDEDAVEAVTRFADTIDRVARRIEARVHGEADGREAAPRSRAGGPEAHHRLIRLRLTADGRTAVHVTR